MQIVWAQNPLATGVELDVVEQTLLWHKLKIDALESRLYRAYFRAKDNAPIPEVLSAFDIEYIGGDSKKHERLFDEELNEELQMSLKALAESHDGDCVCQPCSCLKCRTEELLEINTIGGLGKYEASAIGGAFRKSLGSLDGAIEALKETKIVNTNAKWPRADFEVHIPRWLCERKLACEWLMAYRAEHFSGEAT
jgi:hypothetical protein